MVFERVYLEGIRGKNGGERPEEEELTEGNFCLHLNIGSRPEI